MARTLDEAVVELRAALLTRGLVAVPREVAEPARAPGVRAMRAGDYATTTDGRLLEVRYVDAHAIGTTYSVVELWPNHGRTDHVFLGPDFEKTLVGGQPQLADHKIARWLQTEARR